MWEKNNGGHIKQGRQANIQLVAMTTTSSTNLYIQLPIRFAWYSAPAEFKCTWSSFAVQLLNLKTPLTNGNILNVKAISEMVLSLLQTHPLFQASGVCYRLTKKL